MTSAVLAKAVKQKRTSEKAWVRSRRAEVGWGDRRGYGLGFRVYGLGFRVSLLLRKGGFCVSVLGQVLAAVEMAATSRSKTKPVVQLDCDARAELKRLDELTRKRKFEVMQLSSVSPESASDRRGFAEFLKYPGFGNEYFW